MAFQTGSVKLEGKVGDLSFYKVDEEYRVKKNSGHSKKRIETDPNFERTRENATEFGHSSNFAKRLKLSLKQTLKSSFELFQEPSQTNRLIKRMSSTLKADFVNGRGKRRILAENLGLFTGFSVNGNAALKDVFFLPLTVNWLIDEQFIRVKFPAFYPNSVMDFPKDVAKFQFHLCVVSIKDETFIGTSTQTDLLNFEDRFEAQTLDLQLTNVETDDALMVFFGVSFYSLVAGYPVPLTAPSQNALDVIRVFVKSNE